MTQFQQYTKKNGEKAWSFKAYLGINESTGKECRTTRRGFATKKDAIAAYKKLEINFNPDTIKTKHELTYQAVTNLLLVNYERTVKESTYVKTKQIYEKVILPSFVKLKINKIKPTAVQRFGNTVADKYALYRQIISNASRISDYAIRLDYAKENPFNKIIIPKIRKSVDDSERLNFFTKAELE
ncbi:Arm DNA-binding domain-containing protein [Enterococcus sp. AZ103]|uniref:Arm DNA-binding domain-containing protein n=1 Tax=Enterococcus sp. AZ103 TaxID=2774628 RepID=UPI003F1EC249